MSYTDELAKLIAEGLQKAKQGIDTSTNIERGKPSTMQTQTAQKTKYSSAHDMLLSMGTGGGTGDLFSTNVPLHQSIFEKHPKNTQVTPTGTVSGHTGNAGGIKSLIDFLAPAEHPAKDPSSVFNNYGKDIFQKQSEREAEKFFSSYKLKIPSGYENLLSDPNAYMMAYQQTKDAYVSLYAESARRTKELDYKLRGNLSDEERNVLTQKKQGEEFYRDALLLTSHYMPQSDKSLLDETKELMELRDGEEKKKRVEELKKQYDGIDVSFEKFGIKYTNFYNAQKRQEELNKPLETHYQELDALEEEYQHWLDTNDIDMSQHHLREQVYIIDDYGKKIAEKQKIIEEIEHYQNYTLVQKKKDFAQHAITLDDLWALYEHLNPTADADELSGIGTPGGVPMPGEPVGDTSTLPHEVQDKLPQIKKLLPYIEYLKNEEVGIYTYLYSTEGKKSAEEYFGSIKETINYRMAEDEYKRMSGIEKTLYFIPAGLEQFGSGFAQWFSDEKAPTSVTQFKSGMIREEAYDTWKGLGYLYDAGVTVSNMAPSIGLGFINPGLGVASLAVSAGGNAYGDALERGYSARGARLYGVLVGTSEAFLQKMLGGITKLGGAGNIPAKFATKADMIKNSFLRVSAKYGIQLGGEIIEEELQLFIEPALRSIIFDEDYEMPEAQEIIETAVVTAISTGVLESPQIAKSEISNAKYKDLFADSSTELIGKALDIDPTNGQVLEMQKRLAAGKELTGAELRKLVEIQAKHIRQTYERSKKTVSTQEEAVVNKIATDRIADAEKDGTKLSRKQKRDIRNQVMLELERGELSVDSIEGVLGGDAYTAYRKEADKQKALKEEYAELMGMRAADRTGYQDARMQELAKMNLEDTTKTDELRSRLDKAMSGQINGRLTESYRQRELRTKEFKADLNSYPENQRAIVQAAMDSGVLNNTHATHDFVNLVAKLCADKGIGFNFTNNEMLKASGFAIGGKIINGFVNADGITVNVNSAKALNTVVGHEITHVLEGTDLYDQLMQVAKKYTGKNWDAMRNRAEQTYAKRSSDGNILRDKDGNAVFVTDVNLDAEVLADFIGEALFTDEKFLKSLATGNRGLFKKLWDEVKYLCKVATAGSKEARQLEKVKKLFSKLYRDTQVEQKNTADPDGVKYSIGETSDNRPVAIVDSDILGSMDLSTWDDTKKEQAKKAAKDALLNFKDGIYVHGVNYSVTRKSRREFTRSEYTAALYNHNQSTFADKMKTAPYLDDVVLATTQWSQDGKLTHLRKDNFIDFLHGNVLIKAIDNMYSAQVVVGITKNGQYVFYDLVDMKPTSFDIKKEPPTTVSSNNTLNDIHGDSFGNNIAPGAKDVNNKFSLSDPAEVKQAYAEMNRIERNLKYLDRSIRTLTADGDAGLISGEEYMEQLVKLSQEYQAEEDRYNEIEEKLFPVAFTKSFQRDVVRQVRKILSLSNSEIKAAYTVVNKVVNGEITDKAELAKELKDLFGVYSEKFTDETLKEIQQVLRTSPVVVSDHIKRSIADYEDLRKRNFGRIRFAKEGTGVNKLYQELSDRYPHYFPEDIINEEDQLLRMIDTANERSTIVEQGIKDNEVFTEAADTILKSVEEYKAPKVDKQKQKLSDPRKYELEMRLEDITRHLEEDKKKAADERDTQIAAIEEETADEAEFYKAKARELGKELATLRKGVKASVELGLILDSGFDWDSIRSALVNVMTSPTETVNIVSPVENLVRESLTDYYADAKNRVLEVEKEYRDKVANKEAEAERQRADAQKEYERVRHSDLENALVAGLENELEAGGYIPAEVYSKAKNIKMFNVNNNTPQRLTEKVFGLGPGRIINDVIFNRVASMETKGVEWFNKQLSIVKQISKDCGIKPGSKESVAAQMYAEGYFYAADGKRYAYGNAELQQEFPDANTQRRIKQLAADPRVRKIYDDTLEMINAAYRRNGYDELIRLDNYFLHFNRSQNFYARMGLPFNSDQLNSKNLPTDMAGQTADLKPGRPFFSSGMHRKDGRFTPDLLLGLEMYLSKSKDIIWHTDDIQMVRAFAKRIGHLFGQEHGFENIAEVKKEDQQEIWDKIYNGHLGNYARFLNEYANILAGKTSASDRSNEGDFGRESLTIFKQLKVQASRALIAFNPASALTNLIPMVETIGRLNPKDTTVALFQVLDHIMCKYDDGFVANDPTLIRRKGTDSFYRKPYDRLVDAGYAMMGAIDNVASEFVVRAKYNELTRKGMESEEAHKRAGEWAMRLMADRSLGQSPMFYTSSGFKSLFTTFQLEVNNSIQSRFYDIAAEAHAAVTGIESKAERMKKKALKMAGRFISTSIVTAIAGEAYKKLIGYDPTLNVAEAVFALFGWDDDEDDEDSMLDNIMDAARVVWDDLPYVGMLTGGRLPIQKVLPVQEIASALATKDQYGRDLNALQWFGNAIKALLESGLHTFIPGYNQIKKTGKATQMFLDPDNPVSGSYTDSGNMRYPVEETPWNIAQAVLFGQYASDNAREYFDEGYDAMNAEEIAEYKALGLDISDYWNYRESVKDFKRFVSEMSDAAKEEGATTEDALKSKYLSAVKNEIEALYKDQKEVLGSDLYSDGYKEGHAYRTKTFTEDLIRDAMQDHQSTHISGNYGRVGDYHFRMNANGEWDKLEDDQVDKMKTVTAALRITPKEYYRSSEATSAYKWAYEHQDEYAVSRAVTDDIVKYKKYTSDISKIKEDEHRSRKHKVADYINSLDLDYGARIILFRTFYPGDDRYNYDIVEYLNDREEFSYGDIKRILEKLGMQVTEDGKVHW